MLRGRLASLALALVLMASLACVTAPAPRVGVSAPIPALQLSQSVVSPGAWIRLQGSGFRVAEYVQIRVTDPGGLQATIGQVIADGRGDMQADLAPGQDVRNGVSLLSVSGTTSEVTAAVPITVTGAADDNGVASQPQWSLSTSSEAACQQCLLVHGQAP